MPYGVEQNLMILAVLSNAFTPVKVQIGVPIYVPAPVPQPVFAVPAPMPVAVAVQMPPSRARTTTTTTTTPEPDCAIAVPVPVPMPIPMPVQIAVPAQPPPVSCQPKQPKTKTCPPCPPCVCQPSCTPAFFAYCSPCHQKCRCRNSADAPTPLPSRPVPVGPPMYPVPVIPAPVGPPPVVVIPLPPFIRRPDITSSDSESSDSCETDFDGCYTRRRKKSRKTFKIHRRTYRRAAGDESGGNSDLVKPVLSYVADNGDVKFKTNLSKKDAMKLLTQGSIKTSDEKSTDEEGDDDIVVIKKGNRASGRKYNKVELRDSPTNRELKKDKNKFIFKPSSNKEIKAVAVSFKVK